MRSVPGQEPTGMGETGKAPSGGKRRAIRVIATIMAASAVGFAIFTAVSGLLSEAQEIHAFHNLVVSSLLLVVSAPAAIAVARAPERSLQPLVILAAVATAGVSTMALSLTLDPFTLPFVILVGVLWALRSSGEPSLNGGRTSAVLLVFVLAAAAPLVAYALGQAELQRTDNSSEHAEFYHWVETSFYAIAILLLALLAALRPAAFRLSAWCATAALAILGAGSLLLADYPSAPGTLWGWVALAGSIAFIAVAEWEVHRTSAPSPR